MFEGATVVQVIREGGSAFYDCWSAALPNVRIGDRVRVSWPDGLIQCIDVVSREQLPKDVTAWKPILVPCDDSP